MTGCASRAEETSTSATISNDTDANVTQSPTPNSEGEAASANSTATAPTTLLVYFSRAGMNYTANGPVHTDRGNTAVMAGYIANAIDCDVYEIEAAEPYPYDYEATTDQAMAEQQQNARPAIAGELPNLAPYDTILVGSGVWWGDPPMIMHTFFENVDTSGKTIIPFTTHAGSGMGSAVSTYRALCPEATVRDDGLAVSGENVQNSNAQVEEWIAGLSL